MSRVKQHLFIKSCLTLDRFIVIGEMENNDGGYFELQPYKKNVSFVYEKLQLTNKEYNDDNDVYFNLWDNNFNLEERIHITDDLKIHYKKDKNQCLIFNLKFDNINGTIDKGQIKGIRYFRPTSLIQTGLIYDIVGVLEDKLCEKLKVSFLDIIDRLGMFRLNCKQDIPLNKVVYLRDLIVVFDRVDKVNHKGKTKYCIVSNVVQGDILLQK